MREIVPSCTNCKYANLYIPAWSYPHSTPFCSKEQGLCREDKVCEHYELIGRLSR